MDVASGGPVGGAVACPSTRMPVPGIRFGGLHGFWDQNPCNPDVQTGWGIDSVAVIIPHPRLHLTPVTLSMGYPPHQNKNIWV
jgi:hypothetical protein